VRGYIEAVYTPNGVPAAGQLAFSDPLADAGSLCIDVSPVVNVMQVITSRLTGPPVDSTQGARIDTRLALILNRKAQITYSWNGNYITPGIDGVQYVRQQIANFGFGNFPQPANIAEWQFGKNMDLSNYGNIATNRFTWGNCQLTGWMTRQMAASAGVTPASVIVAGGDSNTGFNDSWIVFTNLLIGMGPGRAVVANHGVSGDTTAQLLARLPEMLDCAPNTVIILVGTNDIFRDGTSWAALQPTFETLFARIKAFDSRIQVIAGTIPPMRADSIWGWYTAGKETQRELSRTWMLSLPRNVDAVVDLDTVLNDGAGQLKASLTYDGVHFNATGQSAVGDCFWRLGLNGILYP
jgi:lysophospholipase L1-like esterase